MFTHSSFCVLHKILNPSGKSLTTGPTQRKRQREREINNNHYYPLCILLSHHSRQAGREEGRKFLKMQRYHGGEEQLELRTGVWRRDSILSLPYELGTSTWRKRKRNLRIKVRASGVENSKKDKCSLITHTRMCTHTHTHKHITTQSMSNILYLVISAHVCIFQPGVHNVLDLGLERPNNFSSRVTLVSESITFLYFLFYCLFPSDNLMQ